VYIASNAAGAQPTATVSRWCRKTNSRINVEQPQLIRLYNRHMGGVDRCDQNVSAYDISVWFKKWWWALFVWILDMVLQNCWQVCGFVKREILFVVFSVELPITRSVNY